MSWTHKIAVVGSRPVPGDDPSVKAQNNLRREAVRQFVDHLDSDHNIVISGGAAGTDSWAVERAKERGLDTVVIKPDWKKHGKGAGFRRNKQIVAQANSVVAFWDGNSKGTEHTIKVAIEAGKHTAVFSPTGTLMREYIPNDS